MRFPAVVDRPVAASLRALPGVAAGLVVTGDPAERARIDARSLFERAELHAVAGVLWDAWKAGAVPIDPALARRLEATAIAREMDHEAHIAVLHRIDALLTVPALVLKHFFARRYYARPSSRGTSDIDLLVAEHDLERAAASLAPLGYAIVDSPREIARAKREHHHLHCAGRGLPDLELHFHAYRGFGVTVRAEMLAERSTVAEGYRRLRVAAPEDELVYLAVHAASHRFGRLGWLYDVRLLSERMSPAALGVAATRARTWGLAHVLALAGELLVDVLGVSPSAVRPLGTLPRGRRAIARAIVTEPRTRLLGAATRFVYTLTLSGSTAASLEYLATYSSGQARRILGVD